MPTLAQFAVQMKGKDTILDQKSNQCLLKDAALCMLWRPEEGQAQAPLNW